MNSDLPQVLRSSNNRHSEPMKINIILVKQGWYEIASTISHMMMATWICWMIGKQSGSFILFTFNFRQLHLSFSVRLKLMYSYCSTIWMKKIFFVLGSNFVYVFFAAGVSKKRKNLSDEYQVCQLRAELTYFGLSSIRHLGRRRKFSHAWCSQRRACKWRKNQSWALIYIFNVRPYENWVIVIVVLKNWRLTRVDVKPAFLQKKKAVKSVYGNSTPPHALTSSPPPVDQNVLIQSSKFSQIACFRILKYIISIILVL